MARPQINSSAAQTSRWVGDQPVEGSDPPDVPVEPELAELGKTAADATDVLVVAPDSVVDVEVDVVPTVVVVTDTVVDVVVDLIVVVVVGAVVVVGDVVVVVEPTVVEVVVVEPLPVPTAQVKPAG